MRDQSRLNMFLYGALGAVIIAAIIWAVPSIEDDLATRAMDALADEGITADVAFSGQDATISGELSPEDQQRAIAAVESIEGVAAAAYAGPVAAGSTTTTAAAPSSTTDPATNSTTATETTTTQAASSTTTTTQPQGPVPTLEATLAEGALILRGSVPDATSAARIAAVADLIYGPFVTNELTVDDSLPSASWVPAAASAVSVLPIVGSATLEIAGEQASITALAPTDDRAAQLQGALAASLGPDVALSANVGVTGTTPPTFQAVVPGDGTIVLGGTLPNRTVLERIAGSAIQLYGADNVTNNMTIGDNTDANFSMYRVPVALVPLSAFPQWELDIVDDVITGALRGGATFASGSGRLSPQLQALLDVGAGILLRNPTIGMTIEGHTDSVGSEESNQTLSEVRAAAAVDYLVAAGVDVSRLTAVGYGESRPAADNGTAEGRAVNRRVEFVLGPLQRGGG